jgi:phosphoribosylformylglycinamidine synthase subunit PurL
MVGLIESLSHVTASAFQDEGDEIVLLGEPTEELGGSEYLLHIHGLAIGTPPACDPAAERRLIDALLAMIRAGMVRSAHDCSDGGLAVALAECAILERDAMLGFDVDLTAWSQLSRRALLFGEAHARIVVSTLDSAGVLRLAQEHGVPARVIGQVRSPAHGAHFVIGDTSFQAPVEWLARAFHEAIPDVMDGKSPAESAVASAHAPITD